MHVLRGAMVLPLMASVIVTILGILMTRYNFIGLSVATIFREDDLFNWIGSILVLGGSIATFFIWLTKEPPEKQRIAGD